MPRRPTKVERRRRILEAAREVFPDRGYSATHMSDIAAAAHVGKGTLYEYFRSKEDLFSTLVLDVLRESLDTLTAATRGGDPASALGGAIDYVVDVALAENLDLYRLFYDFWGVAAASRVELRNVLREEASKFRGLFSRLVRDGQAAGDFRADVDPEELARALSAAVDGLSLQIVILGEAADLRAYASILKTIFLGALVCPGSLEGASLLKEEKR